MNICSTLRSAIFPFREPASPLSNSIQQKVSATEGALGKLEQADSTILELIQQQTPLYTGDANSEFQRVFNTLDSQVELLESLWRCPKCGGPMAVIERLTAAQVQLRSPPLWVTTAT
jgi:hypothetical protein